MRYCNDCAEELTVKQENISWYCDVCKSYSYSNPIPVADCLLVDEDGHILMGIRNKSPEFGKLNAPGGFVDPNETFEQAIKRELFEELKITDKEYGALKYGSSRVHSHSQHNKTRQLLCVVFVAKIAHREFEPNDEVSKYVWVKPEDLIMDEVSSSEEYNQIMQITVGIPSIM